MRTFRAGLVLHRPDWRRRRVDESSGREASNARRTSIHGDVPERAGKHDEAIAQLSPEVKRNGEVDADISYSIGSVYALEGLANDAFEWLERSIALGNANHPC